VQALNSGSWHFGRDISNSDTALAVARLDATKRMANNLIVNRNGMLL